MRARVGLGLAAAVIAASGCLPSRDNPHDPARSPAPVLAVVDRTDGAGCASDDPNGEWPPVTVTSRGRCLALDARGTTDPQDTDVTRMTFTFQRIVAEDDPTVVETLAEDQGAILPLDPAYVRGLPVLEEIAFRVIATDPSGARGTGTAHLTLLNTPPTVTTSPPRIVPLHGDPWEPLDTPRDVTFLARATDPDGDPITQWRWTDSSGTVLATTSSLTLAIDTGTAGRQLVFAEAYDGAAYSSLAPTSVSIGEPSPWASSLAGGLSHSLLGRLGRRRTFPTLYQDATPLDATVIRVARMLPGDEPRVVLVGDPGVILATWPDLSILSVADPGFVYSAEGLTIDGSGRVWVAARPFNQFGTEREIQAYDTTGDVLTPATPALRRVSAEDASFSDTQGPDVLLAADDAGRIWVAGRLDPIVRVFPPDLPLDPQSPSPYGALALGSVPFPADAAVKALTRRPGDPDVWALVGQSLAGSQIVEPALVRMYVDGAGTVRSETFDLGTADADGLAWIDGDRFWSKLGERGTCLVDASIFVAAGSLEPALEVCHPTPVALSLAVPDPAFETAWFTGAIGQIAVRASPSGLDVVTADAFVMDLDPSGELLVISGNGFQYGPLTITESLRAGAATGELPISASTIAKDGEGGVWITTGFPRALQHHSANGALDDFITELEFPTGEVTPVPIALLSGYRDGHFYLFAFPDITGDGYFYDVDLSGRSPGASTRAPARVIEQYTTLAFGFFGVSPPGSSGYLWWFDTFVADELVLTPIDGSGSRSVLPVPSLSDFDASMWESDGSLCYAQRTGLTVDVMVVTSAGGASPLTSITTGDPITLHTVNAVHDPVTRERFCWVSYSVGPDATNPLHLDLFDLSGALVRNHVEPVAGNPAVASAGFSPDGLWLLREGSESQFLDRLQWTGEAFAMERIGETPFTELIGP